MIKYNKAIFGLNLLWRVHGSPIYRTVLPATFSLFVFFMIRSFWKQPPKSVLLHPYAAGVLIGGITFLLVFRVTQSYGRYCKFRGKQILQASESSSWFDIICTGFLIQYNSFLLADLSSQGKPLDRSIKCKANGWMPLSTFPTTTCSRANTIKLDHPSFRNIII